MNAQNKSEAFVAHLARHSFLSLWSHANPRSKRDRELCDVLVLCDPDVIIFSVKDVTIAGTGDPQIEWERWQREAVYNSIKQIYGAERWLMTAPHVIRSDGTPGIALPDPSRRRIHRIAVALGCDRRGPVQSGDYGKGYVHVLCDEALEIILGELDTIEDFTAYLLEKEKIFNRSIHVIYDGNEQDLLAVYLKGGCKLPYDQDILAILEGIWDKYTSSPAYKAKKEADAVSYVWDRLVNSISEDILHGRMECGLSMDQNELCIRTMARENRFSRRILGRSFTEFLDLAMNDKVCSRLVPSPSAVVYVFLAKPHGCSRNARRIELMNRCFVARGRNPSSTTVVGIATERPERGKGHSIDIVHLNKPDWTPADQEDMEKLQHLLGYFSKTLVQRSTEDEYPSTRGPAQPS